MTELQTWLENAIVYILKDFLKSSGEGDSRNATQQCIFDFLEVFQHENPKTGEDPALKAMFNREWGLKNDMEKNQLLFDILNHLEQDGIIESKFKLCNHQQRDDEKSPGKIKKQKCFKIKRKYGKVFASEEIK